MAADFDVAVIGSGFGGAVAACRLAEAGYHVVVLERGRHWLRTEYPSVSKSHWLWDERDPVKNHGWFDIRYFGTISTIAAAGVGGGSLHYANVSIDAHEDLFQGGWPPEINLAELQKYYPKVKEMLEARTIPVNQFSNRTKLVLEAAQKTGFGLLYKEVDLAIRFNDDYAYDSSKPPNAKDSKQAPNAENIDQGFCVHLGLCDLGCPVEARNTLGFNYIPRAKRFGAQVKPLHIVRNIEPVLEGYKITFQKIEGEQLLGGSLTARIVIVSGGSIGSTELLLRCRDKFKSLPNLGPMLGQKWSSNANYLTFATHHGRDIWPTRGPTISAAVKFLDANNYKGNYFVIEDGGYPDVLTDYRDRMKNPGGQAQNFSPALNIVSSQLGKDLMPWFAQGRDEPIGKFSLRRQFLGLFGPKVLHLSWDPKGARKVLDAIQEIHRKFAAATGGSSVFQLPDATITPHPLGGCPMGTSPQDGLVNHKGEVFGYKNLYVADGSIIPRPVGHNPSKTIAALSERIAAHIISETR